MTAGDDTTIPVPEGTVAAGAEAYAVLEQIATKLPVQWCTAHCDISRGGNRCRTWASYGPTDPCRLHTLYTGP